MRLKTFKRQVGSKGLLNKLRREGSIPAVVYSKGKKGEHIYLDGAEFKASLRCIDEGYLSTMVFDLEGEGFNGQVIVKDIQYNIISYDVIHLDFLQLYDEETVVVNVPIECVGANDCVGVKLGGVLRQVIRSMKIKCPSNNIPRKLEVDVSNLSVNQSLRLRDLAIPSYVEPIVDMNEVVVVIAKR